MKFNIVGNPPYNGKGEKFYLKVMSECEKFADTAVWVVPTDFVDNPRIKENINYKHVEILDKRFQEFSRIKTVVGDAQFENADFFSDVGIFVFNKKNQDLLDLRYEKFSDPAKYRQITQIVDNYLKNKKTIESIRGIKNNYYIQLSEIRGHRRCWDWPTLVSQKRFTPLRSISIDMMKSKQFVGFFTINECNNFINWINTDLAMFLNYLYKFNQHSRYDHIPIYDFNNPINEDIIYKEIGIDKYKDFIIQEMKIFGYKTQK